MRLAAAFAEPEPTTAVPAPSTTRAEPPATAAAVTTYFGGDENDELQQLMVSGEVTVEWGPPGAHMVLPKAVQTPVPYHRPELIIKGSPMRPSIYDRSAKKLVIMKVDGWQETWQADDEANEAMEDEAMDDEAMDDEPNVPNEANEAMEDEPK